MIIHLPKNRVIVSTALMKIFSKKTNRKLDKSKIRSNPDKKSHPNPHSNLYFEELKELIKLHHNLFFKRFHIRNLSIKSIMELILGTGIEKDMLIRDVYVRKYNKK